MIKKIRLSNFFSFKDETIDFEKDVNLLVGINGSGKSNFFKAIQLLKIGVTGNNENNALFRLVVEEWGGFDNIYFKGISDKNGRSIIELEYFFDGKILSKNIAEKFNGEIIYKIEIIKTPSFDNYEINERLYQLGDGMDFFNSKFGSAEISIISKSNRLLKKVEFKNPHPSELILSVFSPLLYDFMEEEKRYDNPTYSFKDGIKDISIYEYFDTTSKSEIRKASSTSATVKKLLPNGKNLPQLLHTLKLKNKSTYRKIVKSLKDINPNFNDFDFNVLGAGQMEMYLDENNLDSAIHLAHISDGTLRYLCLLGILLNPNRGSLVCIDEPEVGLHPDMIFNISTLMQEAAEETTFLIATHSPAFLNTFKIGQIRVFEKDSNNITTVKQFTENDFEGWYEEFNPGNMWKAGDLGGTRW